jgi:cell division protein FtsW
LLVVVVVLLNVIGLMMVLSASSVQALHTYGGAWLFFQRQLVWVLVGGLVLGVLAYVDYRRLQRLGGPLLVLSAVLLAAVLVPGVGIEVSGSTRWLGVGPLRFQPSELAKLAALLFAADLLSRRADRMAEPREVLRPVALSVGAVAALILLQPDMGTTMLLVLTVLTVLFVGGLPLLRMAGIGVAVMGAAVVAAKLAPYRWARVSAFLNPGEDPANTGYQVTQSLVALGTGHLTGIGLGASRAKWGFLPNAHTDFIFSIVGEELGLLGAAFVVGLFVAFAVLGVGTALRAPDRYGVLVAAGVTAWVAGQALVNIGAVTGVMPVTGVPLPFVSFGGTSVVTTMAAVGILVSVARQGVAAGDDGR